MAMPPLQLADGELYVTGQDLAQVLGRCRDTLRAWVRKGRFPAPVGRDMGRPTWRLSDAVAALEALRIEVPEDWLVLSLRP